MSGSLGHCQRVTFYKCQGALLRGSTGGDQGFVQIVLRAFSVCLVAGSSGNCQSIAHRIFSGLSSFFFKGLSGDSTEN